MHRRQQLAGTSAPGQAMSEAEPWSPHWHLDVVKGKLR
jgi:hypothetical protein